MTAVNTFGATGLLSRRTSTNSAFYTFDPRGSVAESLDSGGNVLSASMFDAYGATLAAGPGPFGFAAQSGYYLDSETGLYLLGHRYYDSSQGRFLNRDPSGYNGGMNLYGYANQDPVNLSDPLGLNPSPWGTICSFYLHGCGGLSKLVDDNIMFGAGAHMGLTWSAYDDGRASLAELVGAGGLFALADVTAGVDAGEDAVTDVVKVGAEDLAGTDLARGCWKGGRGARRNRQEYGAHRLTRGRREIPHP